MQVRLLVILTSIIVLASRLAGQNQFEQKPFHQWTREEAVKVLDDSPWSKKQEVRIKYAKQVQPIAGAPSTNMGIGGPTLVRTEQTTASVGGAQAPVDFTFTLRLRSALPIRQALVRLKQIEAKYDQMSDKERNAFEAKTKGLLECPACADNYVLTLSSRSREDPGADAIFTLFKGGRLADLQRYIYLVNERGERRELIHFVAPKAPGDEAIFFFPRLNEKGAPLLTADNRELTFNVTKDEVNIVTNFKIDVSRLVIDGKVEF